MKREKNFYYFLVMISYIICFCLSLILACRTVSIGNLTPTGAFVVYPLTYFIAILFAERYGKKETRMLFNYSVFAFIFMVLLITLSSILPVHNGPDGLEVIFNLNYRMVFAALTSFYVSQYLNLGIYYYISGFRGFKFLIASVIAVTVDSLIFILLAFVGAVEFSVVMQKFTSQYVLSVFMMIFYTILFTYLIDTVVEVKPKEIKNAKVEEPKKEVKKAIEKPVVKEEVKVTKTTTKKPATTAKKETTKKTTTSKTKTSSEPAKKTTKPKTTSTKKKAASTKKTTTKKETTK